MLIFLLIVIICLSLGAWFVLCCLCVIPVRQVLVTYDRVTGNARRIIVGPRIAPVWPLESTLSLDLTIRTAHLSASDVVTSDLAVTVSLDIFYASDPALLQAADLDRILPALTEVEAIVQSWADYILRSLATGYATAELLTVPARRSRLEGLLRNTLQDRMQPFGVRIYTIRLLCRPVPMMFEAQLAATRTELVAQARAQALAMLVAALGPDHNLAQILPLEMLQRVQQGDPLLLTALNLPLPVASKINHQDSLAMHWMLASR
jgi:hypothetical protein